MNVGATLPPPVAAKRAGLTYVMDDQPGFRRQKSGRGIRYTDPEGRTIRDRAVLQRIAKLAIPPAWTSVWICPDEDGHLQATGFDARGRKQYRYHEDWRAIRDATKYHRLRQFAAVLPMVRRRVEQALKLPGLPREKLIATVIKLLDIAAIRIGNEEYAVTNGSFGLTTLQNRHVQVTGFKIRLRFRGKSGQSHQIEIDDPRLARIVRRCSELPGQRLFQFLDDEGKEHPLGSADVNDAIREWTGGDFTAKDFRTWCGSVNFVKAVAGREAVKLTEVIQQVAATLGNTPTICRKHYIHPLLIEQFSDGRLQVRLQQTVKITRPRGLDDTERLLLKLLAGCRLPSLDKKAVVVTRRIRRTTVVIK